MKLPRVRFTVRRMLGLVLILGCVFGWVVHLAHVQRDAVAAIHRIGGRVHYDWEWKNHRPMANPKPWAPKWVVDRVGPDYFGHVNLIGYKLGRNQDWHMAFTMADAGHPDLLRKLSAEEPSETDAGLVHLQSLTGLRELILYRTDVTDAGLVHLERLTGIESLDLAETKVTDAGLAHLGRLTRLRLLGLDQTRVTDAGLKQLGGLTRLRNLFLDNTRITDGGLKHLEGLRALTKVSLCNTKVTVAGVAKLRTALPRATIVR